MAPMMSAFTDRMLEQEEVAEGRKMLTSGLEPPQDRPRFFTYLAAGIVFSTLGGIVGTLIFRKPARPPVIDVPPSDM